MTVKKKRKTKRVIKKKQKTKRGRNVQQLVNTVDRKIKALELRKAGANYQSIADALGYRGASGAFKAVQSGLKAVLREPAEELRTLELERLDGILMAIYPKARQGDSQAIDRCLRVMERRSKLLGLDAPAKYDITWQTEVIQLIANGQLTSHEVREELGEDLARGLFESAGIHYVESGKVTAESGEDSETVVD